MKAGQNGFSQQHLESLRRHLGRPPGADLQGIRKRGADVLMEIHDDGKSFDVERVLFTKRRERLGVLGMRERVEMVGGTFAIRSAPGRGTTITGRVPLADVARG